MTQYTQNLLPIVGESNTTASVGSDVGGHLKRIEKSNGKVHVQRVIILN